MEMRRTTNSRRNALFLFLYEIGERERFFKLVVVVRSFVFLDYFRLFVKLFEKQSSVSGAKLLYNGKLLRSDPLIILTLRRRGGNRDDPRSFNLVRLSEIACKKSGGAKYRRLRSLGA